MIHVKKDRCGYDGYVCKGVPSLSKGLCGELLTHDPTFARLSNFEFTYSEQRGEPYETVVRTCDASYIDNFLNIPSMLRGFVVTWSPIKDMDMTAIPSEVSCNTNTDPFSEDGFLNLFVTTYPTKVDARSWINESVADPYKLLISNNVMFGYQKFDRTTEDDGILEPGLIEPPITVTPTKPPTVKPSWYYYIDGIINIITHFKQWFPPPPPPPPITVIPCEQFAIALEDEDTTTSTPTYKMGSGVVYVNGKSFAIEGKTGLVPPFYLYANIIKTDNVDGTMSISVSVDNKSIGDRSYGIGGVSVTDNSDPDTGLSITRCHLMQERCTVADSIPERIPEITPESACEQFKIELESGDPIGGSPTYKMSAGIVYVDGESFAIEGKTGLTPPFYLYANISKSASSNGKYSLSVSVDDKSTSKMSYGIGGVSVTATKYSDGSVGPLVYQLMQERCTVSVTTNNNIPELLQVSACEQFRIELESGNPIGGSPTYKMSTGSIYVNDRVFSANAMTGLVPPFYIYVNIHVDEDDGSISINIGFSPIRGWMVYGIGGVRAVKSQYSDGSSGPTVYQLMQERCTVYANTVTNPIDPPDPDPDPEPSIIYYKNNQFYNLKMSLQNNSVLIYKNGKIMSIPMAPCDE